MTAPSPRPHGHDHAHDDAAPGGHASVDPDQDPTAYWEGRYGESERMWSGRPNATTADVAADLPRGNALDLGCGEGADAIWLARQGWRTTGVDISSVAVGRARAAASELGLDEDAVRFDVADLATWTPEGPYDLVTASFLHSSVELPRTQILRRVADAVAPGGHLLAVTHAAPPPWAGPEGHLHDMPSPAEELAELDLGDEWEVVLAETRTRAATSPDGEPAELEDGVLLLRRR
ncbi:class I SAM-dependent methyltransferase [Georgenia sp. Z1344]|uniref:class I SAM-dependent methyltransferase n=1 Tax=Georgenia sp. Z1344 TaxID=3416706 RepID=UPI003CF9BD7F